jgi:hypothetical protein
VAPCRIFTKNGLVTSFVIRPTLTFVAVCLEELAAANVAQTALTASTSTNTSTNGRLLC